jgi:hypothetical protein
MSDRGQTLAEIFEKRKVLLGLKGSINTKLAFCREEEQAKIESLSNRALHPQCSFDRKHRLMIYALALAPDQVDWIFKMRERLHRLLCRH